MRVFVEVGKNINGAVADKIEWNFQNNCFTNCYFGHKLKNCVFVKLESKR